MCLCVVYGLCCYSNHFFTELRFSQLINNTKQTLTLYFLSLSCFHMSQQLLERFLWSKYIIISCCALIFATCI